MPHKFNTPTTSPIEVISLDEELTVSGQETAATKKSKSTLPPTFVRSSKTIIHRLAKSGASSKNCKGKSVSSQGDGSLRGDERDLLRADAGFLRICKGFLEREKSGVEQRHREEKKAIEVEHSKRCSALERAEAVEVCAFKAENLLKQLDGEVDRRVAQCKDRADFDLLVGKESVAAVVGFVTKFQNEDPKLLDLFTCFKAEWPEEYFEDLLVATTPSETLVEVAEVANEMAEEPAIIEAIGENDVAA
ncbi:hypothetical protein LIER_06137 [Lithospermum erythrorhizon]|uniref:Uncharacterized protein n=1 Tax=Lithospermum erythrorhizon TaxID=34254 RepID=A0AAV3P4F2_LITER